MNMCKLCPKPVAYEGAEYCSSECCARWEMGERPSDEALVEAAARKVDQPERHMVTMPAEVREAVSRIPDYIFLSHRPFREEEAATWRDLDTVLAWARKRAEERQ